MFQFADRVEQISPFRVMEVLARANELERSGTEVIHLEVGEPDFPTPAAIVRAAQTALQDGRTRYTPAVGIPELRSRLADWYRSEYNYDLDPERILITAGGSGALMLAVLLTVNPGAGVLMTDPGYPCNRHFVAAVDGRPQLLPVTAASNYQLDHQAVNDHWLSHTRGVLLSSPANPTGTVVETPSLQSIAAEVADREGFLIVDEIYHGLVYDNRFVDTALKVDAIVVNSFSKYFGMTGWRLGWIVVPERAIPLAEKLAQNLFICPSSIAQYAALEAFGTDAQTCMRAQRQAFEQRRNLLIAGLRDIGFEIPVMPNGAFYVYAKLPERVAESSEVFCRRVLEDHGVAITPGTDFGEFQSDRHVRLSYAADETTLTKGLDKLRQAML